MDLTDSIAGLVGYSLAQSPFSEAESEGLLTRGLRATANTVSALVTGILTAVGAGAISLASLSCYQHGGMEYLGRSVGYTLQYLSDSLGGHAVDVKSLANEQKHGLGTVLAFTLGAVLVVTSAPACWKCCKNAVKAIRE